MSSSLHARLLAAAGAVVVAGALNLGVIAPPADVHAELCGAFSGSKCWEEESCSTRFVIWSQCTTEYKYYGGERFA